LELRVGRRIHRDAVGAGRHIGEHKPALGIGLGFGLPGRRTCSYAEPYRNAFDARFALVLHAVAIKRAERIRDAGRGRVCRRGRWVASVAPHGADEVSEPMKYPKFGLRVGVEVNGGVVALGVSEASGAAPVGMGCSWMRGTQAVTRSRRAKLAPARATTRRLRAGVREAC